MDLTIERVEHFPADELIARLRRVTMLKHPEVFIYRNADISLREMDTNILFPAQTYVLVQEMQKVRRLKWELARLGYDLFRLEGYIKIWLAGEDSPIDLLPPVVEESVERNGRVVNIINDGMHRLYLAYLEWTTPQVVFVRDVPANFPYYAYPNPGQWSGIKWVESLPEGFVKKWHRISDYKTLYRDFNSAFDNVGGPRGRFVKAAS